MMILVSGTLSPFSRHCKIEANDRKGGSLVADQRDSSVVKKKGKRIESLAFAQQNFEGGH